MATPALGKEYTWEKRRSPGAASGKTMESKKTIRIPLAADGTPLAADRRKPAQDQTTAAAGPAAEAAPQAAPQEVVTDEITVPVRSSIESSLTFELLRRQSTDDEEDEEPKS
jgi:hypothetical protein